MRVTGEGAARAATREAEAARRRGRFDELVRRHAAGQAGRAAPAPAQAEAVRRPAGEPPPGVPGEAPAPGRRAATPRPARAGAGAEAAADPAAGAARPAAAAPQLRPAPEPARAVLALEVRAVVPVVEAFRLGGREALALDFGRALGVELRHRPGGVELSLTAAPALAPAARAELPGLLRALAARGVPVLRAEVRDRGEPGGVRRERR